VPHDLGFLHAERLREIAERFMVIAPDLPGIGDSEVPANGLDMKSAAIRMLELWAST
jgi:pimeloyl-ACP methyl ester carboxylesterase